MMLFAIFRRMLGFREYVVFSANWYMRIFQHRKIEKTEVAHLLVVKNKVYAGMASISIRSFAHYNSNYRFIVYVDLRTSKYVRRKLLILYMIDRQLVEIQTVDDSEKSWQALKLEIILRMKGTSEIFMDADLRWNGMIPEIQSVTYLVSEFEIDYNELKSRLKDSSIAPKCVTMKNTSFFSWGNQKIDVDTRNLIFELQAIFSTSKVLIPGLNLNHLSEQLALSIVVNEFQYKVHFLKKTDAQYDRGLVESSYFGASGRRFGILGDMNEKI